MCYTKTDRLSHFNKTHLDMNCLVESLLELRDVKLGGDDRWLCLWAAGTEVLERMVHHAHRQRPEKHVNRLK